MPHTTRLAAYHFYEDDWESYDQLRTAFEWEVPETFNIAAYICDRWADADGVAIRAENTGGGRRTLTYADLDDAATRLARWLRDKGVERGDRVGVNTPQRPETLVAHIACWKLGAMSVPLSTLFGPDALGYRLGDSEAVACVVDHSNVDTLRSVRADLDALETTAVVGPVDEHGDPRAADTTDHETDFWTAIESSSPTVETATTDADADALLLYTSGTTGDPKGVRHAHRVLLGHLPCFVTSFSNLDISDDAVYWTPSEWAWIGALFDVVVPALFYGTEVVAYNGKGFDPATAGRLIERYEVTNFFAPPTALRMMMRAGVEADVGSVRVVTSGGESLGDSLVTWAEDAFGGVAVHEVYGQTEVNLVAGDCTALTESRDGMVGPQVPGHDVHIVDPETAAHTVAPGTTGEIAVRYSGDPVCMKEYWGKPDRTAAKRAGDWILTEDLGWLDEDGYLAFESRKDDVIISASYRIGPEEIEETLASHEAVADAAVIGIPDEERGEVPKAFVVAATDAESSDALADALEQHVKNRLAKYEYPREVEFVEELPTTSTGKVRRASLREREGIE